MSGVASAIGKIFSTVGSAAARVSSSVAGIGATVFTAGAAGGAGAMASGGLNGIIQNVAGNGVIANVLSGAVRQAGYGAVMGAVGSATSGGNPLKGALAGGLGGAALGGLSGFAGTGAGSSIASATNGGPRFGRGVVTAETPTGLAPSGRGGRAPTASVAGGGGILNNPLTGQIVTGLGKGLSQGLQARALGKEQQRQRDFTAAQQQKISDSFSVDPSAYRPQDGGVSANSAPPGPAATRYRYDTDLKKIVREAA